MTLEMIEEIVRGVSMCTFFFCSAWALRGIFGK